MYHILKQAALPRQKAYIVGGAVRDILLNKKPDDIDIAVSEDPEKYGNRLAKITNGKLIIIGKDQKKIAKVISRKGVFDISPIRDGSINKDLALRDFTINAIALNIEDNAVTDPFCGAKDIEKKKIAPVSENIFKKDPVRLIRAYRIAAHYNFTISKTAFDLIKKYKNLITEAAAERITKELFKILSSPVSCRYIIQMADAGLLFSIFPELFPLIKNLAPSHSKPLQNKKECSELKHATILSPEIEEAFKRLKFEYNVETKQDTTTSDNFETLLHNKESCPISRRAKILNAGIHGVFRELKFEHNAEIGQDTKLCKSVFAHTIRAYNLLETILRSDFNPPINPAFITDKKNIPSLKLAILLHDIGKPATKKISADNTATFEGHDEKGAELAKKTCKRLKTSSKQTDYIEYIIKNHLSALYLFQKSGIAPIAKEAEIKFFIKHGDKTPDLLIHTIADILGKNKTPLRRDIDFVFFGIKLYNKFQSSFLPAKKLPPLITGADIIKQFALKPSPLFAEILREVEIAQLTNKITTKAEALKIAKKIISLNS